MKQEKIQGNHPMDLKRINKEIWARGKIKNLLHPSMSTFKKHIIKLKSKNTPISLRFNTSKLLNRIDHAKSLNQKSLKAQKRDHQEILMKARKNSRARNHLDLDLNVQTETGLLIYARRPSASIRSKVYGRLLWQ